MNEEELLLLEGMLGQNSTPDISVEELLSLEQQIRADEDEDDVVWYFSDSNSDNEEEDNTEHVNEQENNISTKNQIYQTIKEDNYSLTFFQPLHPTLCCNI